MRPVLFFSLAAALAATTTATAQENNDDKFVVSGSIQSDVIIPQEDTEIGAKKYNEWALTNTYADIAARSNHLDAGLRFEFTKHPLPGYADTDKDFKGWGVPNFYIKTHFDKFDLTLGTFYEQFGSGFILRTYEERSLGIDNSLLGGKLVLRPAKGVQIKALSGKQRHYWKWNDAWVTGGDLELSLDQWFRGFQENNTYLTLGASWVNKYESADEDNVMVPGASYKLKFPSKVNAFDVRANLQTGDFSFLAEYAWKTQDPSFENKYVYRTGRVGMLSASYSRKGFSVLAQAKRSDNMGFRSARSVTGLSSNINNLPAFTMEQTYTLAALYPYATRSDGEWAFQGEIGYKFKGRYAPSFKLNYSHVFDIDKNFSKGPHYDGYGYGSNGYGSAFWKIGKSFYRDFNIQYEQKYSRDFKLNFMYMNQYYNNDVLTAIEREDGAHVGDVLNHIFIADAKWKISRKMTLRGEAQYMKSSDGKDYQIFKWNSNGAQGDWISGLLELSVLPNWMFTVSDLYNAGETKHHYYMGSVTFNYGAHRLQVGYGRTRAGFNCTGGVCRYVPASKGVTLSYNYNF